MPSSSGDEDDAAGLQAQVANMLGPLNAKLKKAHKRIDKLEQVVELLKLVGDEQLPLVLKELRSGAADVALRIEHVQGQVTGLASKTALEVMRQEKLSSEHRQQQAHDEQRCRVMSQEIIVQGLEGRVDAVERAMRANGLKINNELAAAVAQLGQVSASLERQRGETEARLGEQNARVCTQHDALLAKLGVSDDTQRTLLGSFASKAEMAELAATMNRRADEAEAGQQHAQAHWRSAHDKLEALHTALASHATVAALERLDMKTTGLEAELRTAVVQVCESSEAERIAWEDKLVQRQHGLEASAQEARRDWHRLAAQVEQLQTHVTDRTLRKEHEELTAAVAALQQGSACKEELTAVNEVAKGAASGTAFAAIEEIVRGLLSSSRAEAAATADRFERTAGVASFAALEERVSALAVQVDEKMGAREAKFALEHKLEKGTGDAISAEVKTIQHRLTSLHERASEAELATSCTNSSLQTATSQLGELRAQQERLHELHEATLADTRARASDTHDLVRAVRALTADAEMRAALDEREVEFLWAAPSQIYGAHGWRPNNGSKSERTPYPVGNFKLAVRHGGEGNAHDVLAQRRKWLNSITVGLRDVMRQKRRTLPNPRRPIPDTGSPHHACRARRVLRA